MQGHAAHAIVLLAKHSSIAKPRNPPLRHIFSSCNPAEWAPYVSPVSVTRNELDHSGEGQIAGLDQL